MERSNNDENFNLGKYISMINRHGRCFMNSQMSHLGLSSGEHIFLFFLYKNDGSSQEEICKNLEIDKGTTTRALKKLEKKKFIYRVNDEQDKRVNRVFLTQNALEIKDDLLKLSEKWKSTLINDFDDNEIEIMKVIIKKLVNNASNYRNLRNRKGNHNV